MDLQEYGTATVDAEAGLVGGLEVKTVDEGTFRASVLRQPDAALGTVVENVLLTSPDAPAKRHIGVSPDCVSCVRWF